MAEIRANREYKFKEFCISEEIPKSPPIKTKRWTFHDTDANSRFYNRPVQKKCEEKDTAHVNWPGETNMNLQYAKPLKKPESDLRAEFFNAYKKYYRRVDIKRLEVQSTLNVDAKFKGSAESVEGESSSYKEKECMEINIVMDTEKDDALVSGKVRRTVLCVSPAEAMSCGKESIRHDNMIIGVPEELAMSDKNIMLGKTIADDSGYCSSRDRSNCLATDLPVTPEQKYFTRENYPHVTPKLKEEQCLMNRTFVPFSEMSQNINNIESNSGKHLLQSSDKVSEFNQQGISTDSCYDIVPKTDSLACDPGSSACFSLTQMTGGRKSTVTGVGELNQEDQQDEYEKGAERTFYNSKMKYNSNDPIYSAPFRNPNEKSRPEIFHNRKMNSKKSMGSSSINYEDVPKRAVSVEDNFVLSTFDNSKPNLSNIVQKSDLLGGDLGSSACFPPNQVAGGNNSALTGDDQFIQNDEKNESVKRTEKLFYNSKIKPDTDDPVYPAAFRNADENSSRPEISHNRRTNSKKLMASSCIDYEGVARAPLQGENFDFSTFINSRANPFSHLQNVEKNFNIDFNSKSMNEYHTVPGPPGKYTNQAVSDDYNIEETTTGSIISQYKNPESTVSQEHPRTKSLNETKNHMVLRSGNEFSDSEPGVWSRGSCHAPFNKTNNEALKPLVVKLIESGPEYDHDVMKGNVSSFSQKEQNNATQRHLNNEALSDPERRDAYSYCLNTFMTETNSDYHPSSQFKFKYCDPVNSSYKKLNVPETFQNTKKSEISNDSKNLCSEETSFISARTENIEEPFVIWKNKNSSDPSESLQINKLTMSDDESDVGSDNDTNSNIQSFSDWYSVREISDIGREQMMENKRDFQSSEKSKKKTYFREVSKISNGTEGKEIEKDGTEGKEIEKDGTEQIPKSRYSNITSVPGQNRALAKCHSHEECSRVLDRNCAKEDPESEISHVRVSVSLKEKGGWTEEGDGAVSRGHYTEESCEEKGPKQRSGENIIPNGCEVKGSQLTEQPSRKCDKNKTMDESNKISNGRDDDAGKNVFSKEVPNEYNNIEHPNNINCYESNSCYKKISKSSSSDILQIGPTYSVHYAPAQKNVLIKGQKANYHEPWGKEKLDDRCHIGSSNPFHCNYENATDSIRKKRNETLSRIVCNHSTPLYYDNYSNRCHHEIICNEYYKPNPNSCVYHNDGSNNCCICEDLNRRFSVINMCQCHIRDTNLHCHYQSNCNCPMSYNHRRRQYKCCLCQEGNRNCCQGCCDVPTRFYSNECSANFQKPDNLHCSCHRCSNEMRIDTACKRRGKCCGTCSGDEQMNSCPIKFDRDRQWMATGHQPMRNGYRCPADANIERSGESSAFCVARNNDVKEPFVNDLGNHCPVYSYNGDCHYTQKLSADSHRKHNSYSYDKEVKNVRQFESTENGRVHNHSFRDIKTELKYNPYHSEEVNFNFPSNVDSPVINELRESKLIPEKKVYDVEETKRCNTFSIRDPSNSYDGKETDTEVPLKGSDPSTDEPLFLCEEQWDTDDGLPTRRVVAKIEERKEEKGDDSGSDNEPIYLREEHWGLDNEDTEGNAVFQRDFHSKSVRHPNDINYLRKGQRSADNQPAGRSGHFLEGEESRKCSSVHAVSDPSFHCEEQWASDEEKCEDHKVQSTLPKNRTKRRKGRDRRSFNPRRWEMVTDLPKNEYIARQNWNNNRQNNYEGGNVGHTMVFQNRKYYCNEQ